MTVGEQQRMRIEAKAAAAGLTYEAWITEHDRRELELQRLSMDVHCSYCGVWHDSGDDCVRMPKHHHEND
jgi:hypothetical protein